MQDDKYTSKILELAAFHRDFDYHAYLFVNGAVSFTVDRVNREAKKSPNRHVSGQELIAGALSFALNEFGPLAPEVFEYWGLRTGADMGAIVYRLIGAEVLSASDEDKQSDFDGPTDLPAKLKAMLPASRTDLDGLVRIEPLA